MDLAPCPERIRARNPALEIRSSARADPFGLNNFVVIVNEEWALKGVRTGDPGRYLVHLGRARDNRGFGGPR